MVNIAVTNRKGGVGKTTHSLHLAAALATIGYHVAIVDTDSQGHIAHSLGVPRFDGLFKIMVDGEGFDGNVLEVEPEKYTTQDYPAKGKLYVIPSSDNAYKIAKHIDDSEPFAMLELLDELKDEKKLHFTIIDTSPTVKELDAQILLATDAFIYVTEAEELAIDGLAKAIPQMQRAAKGRAKHLQRDTRILGILPNKVRNTDAHTVGMETLQSTYKDLLWTPVQLRTVWAEASVMHETLFTYAPSSPATKEAWKVAEKTLEALKQWQTKTS